MLYVCSVSLTYGSFELPLESPLQVKCGVWFQPLRALDERLLWDGMIWMGIDG